MKIAVLGCGSIGQRHLRNLRALGVTDLAAADPLEERRAEARRTGAVVHAEAEEAVRGAFAVLVCTPAPAHVAGIRIALDAGADVFVEKPLAASLDGVDAVLDAAAHAERVLEVGYSLRFDAALRAAKAAVDAGRIGRVLSVRAEYGQYLPDWRPGRDYRHGYNARASAGGGVLLDQSHELDYVRWIFGEPTAVSAVAERVSDLEIDAEDIAVMTIHLAGGAVAEIHVDSVRRDYRRTCVAIGTGGTIEWDLLAGSKIYDAATGSWSPLALASDVNEMYVAEMRAFIDACRQRTAPTVTGADGRRVLELVLAARIAASERREVAV